MRTGYLLFVEDVWSLGVYECVTLVDALRGKTAFQANPRVLSVHIEEQ